MADDDDSEESFGWKVWVVMGGLALAIFVLIALLNHNRSGELERMQRLRDGSLLAMLRLRSEDDDSGRLVRYEASSGKVLAKESLDSPSHLLGQSQSRLWFYEGRHDGLVARSPTSLGELVGPKQIIAANPALSAGLHFEDENEFTFSPDYGLTLIASDGFRYRMDPETLSTQRVEERPHFSISSQPNISSTRVPLEGKAELLLQGDPRAEVMLQTGTEGRDQPSHDPRWASLSFVHGQFLLDTNSGQLLRASGPDSVFVLYRDRIDSQAKPQLARLNLEGGQLWARPIEGEPRFVTLDGEGLLMADEKGLERLDLKSGASLWRQDF